MKKFQLNSKKKKGWFMNNFSDITSRVYMILTPTMIILGLIAVATLIFFRPVDSKLGLTMKMKAVPSFTHIDNNVLKPDLSITTTTADVVEIVEEEAVEEPEVEPEPAVEELYSDEAIYLAKTIYGEARGCSKIEQAAVVWCILNRVDDSAYPDSIVGVVTQKSQFHGYVSSHPVDYEFYELSLDVLDRWNREKNGETDVGRVLPSDYLWFFGDGTHNYFRNEYSTSNRWDWSLTSPYDN